jgi:hypothetical protein
MKRQKMVWGCVASIAACGVCLVAAERLEDTDYVPPDHPAIGYREGNAQDRIAKLDLRLDKGEVKLDYAPNGLGYLPALLKQLDVNIDSQVLVFSKTSTQAARINPTAPRAVYFNDDVAVGIVRGGEVLEFTALDPVQGVKTYTMEAERTKSPGFARRDDCLQCHQGGATLGIPGLLIASLHPASEGERDRHGSSFITDQRTPLKDRWGGWFVTGITGKQRHFGNNTALVDPMHPGPRAGDDALNVTSLEGKFDLTRYLAPTSDVVALMTLEHQTRMTNLLVRIGWDTRIAVHDGKLESFRPKMNEEIEDMIGYMLFADEAPLQEPVQGVSTFTKTFPQRGPKDKQGRTLREFDLKTRLFRYPLSYMIYSEAFENLPTIAKDRIYQRLWDVLSGKDQDKRFASLANQDREAITQIVRETKGNLPEYWR